MLSPDLAQKSYISTRAAALEPTFAVFQQLPQHIQLAQPEQVSLSQHEAETSLWKQPPIR